MISCKNGTKLNMPSHNASVQSIDSIKHGCSFWLGRRKCFKPAKKSIFANLVHTMFQNGRLSVKISCGCQWVCVFTVKTPHHILFFPEIKMVMEKTLILRFQNKTAEAVGDVTVATSIFYTVCGSKSQTSTLKSKQQLSPLLCSWSEFVIQINDRSSHF